MCLMAVRVILAGGKGSCEAEESICSRCVCVGCGWGEHVGFGQRCRRVGVACPSNWNRNKVDNF